MTADEKTLETISRTGRFSKTEREKFEDFPFFPPPFVFSSPLHFPLSVELWCCRSRFFRAKAVSRTSPLAVNRQRHSTSLSGVETKEEFHVGEVYEEDGPWLLPEGKKKAQAKRGKSLKCNVGLKT